ncbi:MAG: protein kinase [Planctomycetota bacterium]
MALRVIVVDDDAAIRALLEEVLGPRGYVVECYDSAGAAWQRLQRGRPNLLILDVGLPDESGLDLLRRLRSLHGPQSYPVLVLSGFRSEGDILGGYEAGADDYLTKPFSREVLLAKCAVLIARSRPAQDTQALERPPNELFFDRYEVRGVLGRGAFGVVYHARDLQQRGQTVALKVCDEEHARDPEHRLRFLRESYALASLDHPAIVSVSDFGLLDDSLYLAMDYVPGPTLETHVAKRGALSERQTLGLLAALAGALVALDAAGLVHRDIKPANIILRDDEPTQPVLVDFGLAKRFNERSLTDRSTVMGTPGYMAPETFLGEPVDHRSDLFALGMVARFAVTGQALFPYLRGVALALRISRGALPPTGCAHPVLTQALEGLLEADRDLRLPSAQALLALLEPALAVDAA